MHADFAIALVLLLFAAAFVFLSLLAGRFVRPRHPDPVKAETYECGEPAVGPAWISFNIRFYQLALIFVIFDVEAALLFPAAVVFKKWIAQGKGGWVLAEVGLFVAILFAGLVYLWRRGDLSWIKGLAQTPKGGADAAA